MPTPCPNHHLLAEIDSLFEVFVVTLYVCRTLFHPQPDNMSCCGGRDSSHMQHKQLLYNIIFTLQLNVLPHAVPFLQDAIFLKCLRVVSVKQRYVTCRPIGKFFMLIVATLPSILILYLWAVLAWQWYNRLCLSETCLKWQRRSEVPPKARCVPSYDFSTQMWKFCGNSQTNCCCLWQRYESATYNEVVSRIFERKDWCLRRTNER